MTDDDLEDRIKELTAKVRELEKAIEKFGEGLVVAMQRKGHTEGVYAFEPTDDTDPSYR